VSWDIGMCVTVDGKNVEFGRDFNYTHNTNPLIRDAGFTEWPNVGGMNVDEFCARLYDTISVMYHNAAQFRAMNPENGWGDYDQLLQVLAEMYEEFLPYPSATVWASI